MRHNSKRPQRGGRPQNKKGGNNKMKVFDSNGPDARIRGTAYQVTEKYELLAKDAETSGNYVMAENYRQHAEHYQRIINEFEEQEARQNAQREKAQPKKEIQNDDLELPASMIAEATVAEGEVVTA